MKNVLLLVHEDPGQEARLQAALDITRALEGHLTCLDVAAAPIIVGDAYGSSATAILIEDAERREAANRERIEGRLANEGVPWTWIDATGDIAGQLLAHDRLADIIVVNRRLDDAPLLDTGAIASQLVVSSGRTVVAVPDDARGFAAGGHALVAFDGSAAASDALRAAVPLLQLASKVTLVEIARDATAGAVEEAATYLSRHGIHPAIVGWHPGADRIADILLAEIGVHKADYVVMGGFGHSRLVESVFGGVSRQMLGESPVPVVMAH